MDQIHWHTMLYEIFPNKSKEIIENVIRMVEENGEGVLSLQEQQEAMVNLLSGNCETDDANSENIIIEEDSNNLLDEAAGINLTKIIIPPEDFASNTLKRLMDIFPDADPSYLERNAGNLAYDNIKLQNFIDNHIENKNYPTLEEYKKRKNEKLKMNKYLSDFKIFKFLLEFPDPIGYFTNPMRKHAFSNFEENEHFDLEKDYVLKCFYNRFSYLREHDIDKMFKICHKDIIKTYYRLKKIPPAFKIPRNSVTLPDVSVKNIPLLQEIAFIQHENEIAALKKEQELNYLRAKEQGYLESCSCCFSNDLIPEDCFLCRKGCIFCKECVRKGAEVAYAEGKTEFNCLSNCGNDYSLYTLQRALDPKIFDNLCHRIQMQEVNNAEIPELEHCPLCSDFAMIPDPNNKIFHCDNCNKDSCRECKHEAHVPLRCNEIEYDEDVRMRTYIENKMTEALLRKCYKCEKTFIKNSGCNKITCSCGAKMCYLCRTPISDYTHFSETGCPLFTNDEQIHQNNVVAGANIAKQELGVDKNPEKLKIDPTTNFKNFI